VCITFGPDVTRRFCEINRLRMIVRSHEVPRSMSGVAVQHDGRLITVFSASNYCGRIGNTGGTMLLTPNLDYQLMEHWSPSLEELVRIEAEEEAATAAGADRELPPGPLQLRRQFSADAELRMQVGALLRALPTAPRRATVRPRLRCVRAPECFAAGGRTRETQGAHLLAHGGVAPLLRAGGREQERVRLLGDVGCGAERGGARRPSVAVGVVCGALGVSPRGPDDQLPYLPSP
jgi:hypothetical protein